MSLKQICLCLMLVFISAVSCAQESNYKCNIDGQNVRLSIDDLRPVIKTGLLSMSNQLNSQSPLRIDETTVLMSTISVNYSIIHNYRVDINSSEWSKEQISKFIEIMKRKQSQTVKYLMIKANLDMMSKDEWIRLYKELEMEFIYNMRDNQGVVFGTIRVTYKDLM